LVPNEVHYMEKISNIFIKNLNFFSDMDILDDMGVSKLLAKVF